MGLREYYADPVQVARDTLSSLGEKTRKQMAKRRISLYCDDIERLLADEVSRIFFSPEVRDRIFPFLRMASANSLLKRISDEIGRPVYASPPMRRIGNQKDQLAHAGLALEMNLDRKMDRVTKLLTACNQILLFVRFIPRYGLCLDILTPDLVSVIPDRDVPQHAAGVVYSKPWGIGGKETAYVLWDDAEYVTFNSNGLVLEGPTSHNFGVLPFVEISRNIPLNGYWDTWSGADLEAATIQVCLLNALILKLHKSQGEKQLAVAGDDVEDAKEQILDGESILKISGAKSLQLLDLQASPDHYLRTKEHIETTIAANYGISRERLNQQATVNTAIGREETGLRERTAEIMSVMRKAENDLFDIVKVVSQEHPEYKLSPDSTMSIDFGELHHRVDRKTQLEIRETERRLGIRSVIDDILEDNPEIQTEAEAWKELESNMEAESEYIRLRRALNVPEDANVEEPGQNPMENGEMGPMVRDGVMTRDEAAEMARTGQPAAA